MSLCFTFANPSLTLFFYIDVIQKLRKNNVIFNQARKMHQLPIPKTLSAKKHKRQTEAENNRLVNIMYHGDDYYIQEPYPDKDFKRLPDLIIEKHCWRVLKFMPKMQCVVKWNDVIRFGRVTFKVTELVITDD